nr:outer membrane beta-barrel protein [Acidobacteriota bacterium]
MRRRLISATLLSFLFFTFAHAEQRPQSYAGALAGISTLSADARSEITPGGVQVSFYKPENGPALNLLFGLHVHEYLTVQANYIWNRNDLTLASVRTTASGSSFYEQPRTSSQRAIVGDLLVYFRERRSVVRPYLSAGLGVVRLETKSGGQGRVGNAVPPPAGLQANRALLRVAVGIDVVVA